MVRIYFFDTNTFISGHTWTYFKIENAKIIIKDLDKEYPECYHWYE